MTTQSTGQLGETIAVSFLKQHKFEILECNYRSKRWGEIDIICIDGDQLVFVEVKTRIGDQQTAAIESITPHKLHKLTRAANYYLMEHEGENLPKALRIDVVTVEFTDMFEKPTVTHYANVYLELF